MQTNSSLFLFLIVGLVCLAIIYRIINTADKYNPELGIIRLGTDGATTSEHVMCKKHVELLYDGVAEHNMATIEWKRLLPKYLKLELAQHRINNSSDLELPTNNHEKFNLLGPVGPKCKVPFELYGKGDEEKRACGLKTLERSSGLECVVFSLGSANMWGFEQDIFNETKCRVETFDCTISQDILPPESIRSRVRFHNVCVGEKDEIKFGKQFLSWGSLLKLTGLTTAPTFLKMDIEGYEFPVVRSIIDSGAQLPLQIAMELHLKRFENGHYNNPNVQSSELIAFMEEVYQLGGYALLDRHDNERCFHCSEIILAKVNCRNHPVAPRDPYKLLLNTGHKMFDNAVKRVVAAEYYN